MIGLHTLCKSFLISPNKYKSGAEGIERNMDLKCERSGATQLHTPLLISAFISFGQWLKWIFMRGEKLLLLEGIYVFRGLCNDLYCLERKCSAFFIDWGWPSIFQTKWVLCESNGYFQIFLASVVELKKSVQKSAHSFYPRQKYIYVYIYIYQALSFRVFPPSIH